MLRDCRLDHSKFEPQDGGSVLVTFWIIAHPDTEDVGTICDFMAYDIDLVLTPPAAKTADELFPEKMRKAA